MKSKFTAMQMIVAIAKHSENHLTKNICQRIIDGDSSIEKEVENKRGGFMRAVLAGDYETAMSRADSDNLKALHKLDEGVIHVDSIDVTPTWRGLLLSLLAVHEDGTVEGRKKAKAELVRMAEVADLAKVLTDKLTAIEARIAGAFDDKELLKIGALTPSETDDILRIINSNEYR